MKIKKWIIFLICILVIFIIPNWLISLYSNQNDQSPKSYLTIEDFEKETGLILYPFYDLEEFITYDRETLLRSSPNYVTISMRSNDKDEKNYRIENLKNGSHGYTVYNNSFKENTSNMKNDVLENGTLYQYHYDYDDSSEQCYVGHFVKEGFYYSVSYTNSDLAIAVAEQKMIDYIKLVEGLK